MSMKRFLSASSREAIKLVRAELGDEAVILSNRAVDGRVEIIATAQDDVDALIGLAPRDADMPVFPGGKASGLTTVARVAQATGARHAKATAAAAARPAPTASRVAKSGELHGIESFAQFIQRSEDTRAAPSSPVIARPSSALHESPAGPAADSPVIAEILQLKTLLQEQIGALHWREMSTRRPLQAKQVSLMLSAGFSPALARAVADKLPADFNEAEAAAWLHSALARNLAAAPAEADLVCRGGVYALVGPTGVGKTTTAAKLAARCAVKYGARQVGLITVDNYRIGAEDQLRAYGQILGVTVHTARDARTLADLLALMRDRHLVLIDTVGMGQRDDRLTAHLQMLQAPAIEPVLFLNASSQAETLDDVVRLYGEPGPRRRLKVIVSKIDEAVKFGFVLDCVIRHKLEMAYVTNGQRVPEDLHPASPPYLVHRALNALKGGESQAFTLADDDVPLVLAARAPSAGAATAAVEHA